MDNITGNEFMNTCITADEGILILRLLIIDVSSHERSASKNIMIREHLAPFE
jgi:hypothetical protein